MKVRMPTGFHESSQPQSGGPCFPTTLMVMISTIGCSQIGAKLGQLIGQPGVESLPGTPVWDLWGIEPTRGLQGSGSNEQSMWEALCASCSAQEAGPASMQVLLRSKATGAQLKGYLVPAQQMPDSCTKGSCCAHGRAAAEQSCMVFVGTPHMLQGPDELRVSLGWRSCTNAWHAGLHDVLSMLFHMLVMVMLVLTLDAYPLPAIQQMHGLTLTDLEPHTVILASHTLANDAAALEVQDPFMHLSQVCRRT